MNTKTTLSYKNTFPPRGLGRAQTAEYIGVSPNKFDQLVKDGRMPTPRRIDTRKIWDIHEVDLAFSALPRETEINPWD